MDKLPRTHLNFYEDEDTLALETSFVDEFLLNERYTHEERMHLADMFQQTITIPKVDHLHTTELCKYDYWLSPVTLSKKEFDMLLEPLENMPLYINYDSMDKQTVAIWRLKCAK